MNSITHEHMLPLVRILSSRWQTQVNVVVEQCRTKPVRCRFGGKPVKRRRCGVNKALSCTNFKMDETSSLAVGP